LTSRASDKSRISDTAASLYGENNKSTGFCTKESRKQGVHMTLYGGDKKLIGPYTIRVSTKRNLQMTLFMVKTKTKKRNIYMIFFTVETKN